MPDAIVVGAGHNGLVAANLLADDGWEVLVLEAAAQPGGAVRTGELTLPGFHHDLFSAFYPLSVASPPMQSLDLERYGLTWRHAPIVLGHPRPGGRSVVVSRDLDVTAASLDADHRGDGDAWRRMIDQWRSIEPHLMGALFGSFPPIKSGIRLARVLGPHGLMDFARQMMLPVRRLAEEQFAGEGAALLLGGSALHSDLPPDAAASGAFGWLMACLAQEFGFPVPEGGAASLIDALVARLVSKGGEVQCGRRVTKVVVKRGRAVGIRTSDGDEIDARKAVLGALAAPPLYRDLIGEDLLPPNVVADLKRFQWDASTVKVDWALSSSTPWEAAELRDAGTVHIADDLDNLTEYSAHISMRRLPARPYLIFGQQAVADPSRSPEGSDTAWAYTHVPREIRADAASELDVSGGKWVQGFVERIEQRVEDCAPGFRDRIIGRHVFSPWMLEEENASLVGGAINGGTAQIHQQLVFRPIAGFGRPETPIAGLYLASSSAHPGGGVHGAAGANAAHAALLGADRLRAAVIGRGGRKALGR